MQTLRFLLFIFITLTVISNGQTVIPPGDVSGTWAIGGSPYEIQGEITIPNGLTLTIEPGVLVEFQGHYKLNVQGRLLAVGTEADTITFTINDTTGFHNLNIPDGGWFGIRFLNTSPMNDSSKIIYCKLEYGKAIGTWPDNSGGAICVDSYDKIIISNCLIANNIAGGVDWPGGGGIALWSSNPEIKGNTISYNSAQFGGGIQFYESSPQIVDNLIVNNSAGAGGGIVCNGNSNPTIINATIENNAATAGNGGGIASWDSGPSLINGTISGNTAVFWSGGIDCGNSNLSLVNVIVSGNTANVGGGIWAAFSDLEIDGCNFINNIALSGSGGGISAADCDLQIDNCSFTENEAINGRGGAIFFKADTTYSGLPYQVTIYNTSFQENTADKVGGVNINNWGYFPLIIDVTIDNCEFNSNEALGGDGGGLSIVNSNVTITDCDFNGNQANDGSGGGVFVTNYDSLLVLDVLIDNCKFINNAADNSAGLRIKSCVFTLSNSVFTGNTAVRYTAGGGFTAGGSGTVSNCLFASNIANTGGGNWNSGGTSVWTEANVNFINCTFANNSAAYGTGLTVGGGGIATTTNCIFWGNSTDQIALDTLYGVGGTLTVNYCDVQDGEDSVKVISSLSTLNWGTGNIDEDPLFVGTGDYPFSLQDLSPCVNAGIPDTTGLNLPVFDLAGHPRVYGGRIDMGAYENQIVVGGIDLNLIPLITKLNQNYPNPFNPTTTINYQIPELNFVTIKVYDVLGSEIATLVNEEKPTGSYEIDFNASTLPSGVYFYQLKAGDFVETKKMVLMK